MTVFDAAREERVQDDLEDAKARRQQFANATSSSLHKHFDIMAVHLKNLMKPIK